MSQRDQRITAGIFTVFAGMLTISCLHAEWRDRAEVRRLLAPIETLTLVETIVDGRRIVCVAREDHVNGTKSLSC